MKKLNYYLKQLLPFTYWSKYSTPDDNKRHIAIWRQWLGKVWNAQHFTLAD